jgi:DNA-binding Xre family transcriptional regulator
MKILEALERANSKHGLNLKKIDLGRALWADSKVETQRVNISNLIHGKTKSINIEMISVLCAELKCDANFLFNIKSITKN